MRLLMHQYGTDLSHVGSEVYEADGFDSDHWK